MDGSDKPVSQAWRGLAVRLTYDLGCSYGLVMVAAKGLRQHLGERPSLDQVGAPQYAQLFTEDLLQQFPRNCSGLRGNEQLAAFQEGVQALGPPGPEEGGQDHFAGAALLGAGPAADFTADHQVAQASFNSIIVRWSLRVRRKDKQLLGIPLNPPA